MRAVRLAGEQRARLEQVSEPEPTPSDAVVHVRAAAICATDRKAYASGRWAPRILGHEFAGVLDDGTEVGVHPEVSCGRCRYCDAGLENRCAQRISIGLGRDGGFAESVAVPADRLLPLESALPVELAPLLEPLACCVHAFELLAPIRARHGLVVGAGAMGILSMWVMQAAGLQVSVLQRSQPRRSLARELGADLAFGTLEEARSLLDTEPAVAIVSAPGGAPLEAALELVEVGGAVHALAGSPGGAPVDANLLHYRHLTLVGSTGSTFASYTKARDLVGSGAVPLHRLPVERIPLDDVASSLARPPGAGVVKTIVEL